jgi:hypothetical protein
MAAILKQETSLAQAKNFIGSFGTNNYYMFHGRPQAWSDDAVPPTPLDTIDEEREIYTSIVGANKIQLANVRHCRQRLDWVNGNYYDMYRDNYDGTVAGVTVSGQQYFPANLAESNFIVLVDAGLGNFHVYKCLDNRLQTTDGSTFAGTPVPSTIKPTGTTNEIIQLSDGYRWKYMYTVSEIEKAQFLAPTFTPIQNIPNNVSSNGAGAVHALIVENGGSGYTSTPTITFDGDGTTAPTVDSVTIVNGEIKHIKLSTFGTGYSYCKVIVANPATGVTAIVNAVTSPYNGHGFNNIDECYADKIMISRAIDPTIAPNGYRYRQVGILRNPTNLATEVLATSDVIQADSKFQYVIDEGAGTLLNGDVIKNTSDEVIGVVSKFETVATQGVQLISTSNGGTGYTVAPLIEIEAPTEVGGVTATAVATVVAGVITKISITNPGSGYETNPSVTITPVSGGAGATATATISPNAFVSIIQRTEDRLDSIDNNDVVTNADDTIKIKVFNKINPTIKYGSGKIVFVENRTPVIRTGLTQERYKFILDF